MSLYSPCFAEIILQNEGSICDRKRHACEAFPGMWHKKNKNWDRISSFHSFCTLNIQVCKCFFSLSAHFIHTSSKRHQVTSLVCFPFSHSQSSLKPFSLLLSTLYFDLWPLCPHHADLVPRGDIQDLDWNTKHKQNHVYLNKQTEQKVTNKAQFSQGFSSFVNIDSHSSFFTSFDDVPVFFRSDLLSRSGLTVGREPHREIFLAHMRGADTQTSKSIDA